MKKKILIIEDEVAICELLKIELEMEGYDVKATYDGIDGVNMFYSFQPDLLILDIMLPGKDGLEICKEISSQSNVYIIMLTAKADIIDKVVGLEIGADDYMTKPFDTRELLARVKAALRRENNAKSNNKKILKNGEITLVPISLSAKINGNELHLTPKEYNILELFVNNTDRVFTREELVENVWNLDYNADTRTVDMHIQRIRKKISKHTDTNYILTVFGMGYKMRNMNES